ncbi:MAG: polyprenyl synthetase family protein [Rhodoferax sp.]|nr:polyprenyl synthetase family protein [Rhodoferax sp.]OIP22113.1 MAG: polyprenyl synthetase [Comamonadaceae bacterium CG2_30_60_41]PIW08262.1 MAG: polyprenyl synthetase [Comamonadaceae bacterium CG17_big_fil_post_rev_8_21_14_2_50_60_13]PIY23892.1 MAG: polyprenyl synthetase [Comamonadaceae bacterium CG_4_10_14_3_um_filter_60_75]PJC15697.1 MAG: polyprenyl synthetase [Comamonadaceae bacterium CG_4_9_14_0_8_um_filter_60_18]
MTPDFDFTRWMTGQLDAVERALDAWVNVDATLSQGHQAPADLMAAMRYAVLDGGKRLRPLLVLAAAQTTGCTADHPAALRAACAVELIHAYSLVHDDMPCMDNDVLRRGKPTVHVRYGEAVALLAGDALQALAFELLTPPGGEVPDAQQAALCGLLARAAGCAGMAGGQAIDLASVGLRLTEPQLREMHRLKTGALLQASVLMGAACGSGSVSASALSSLQNYGGAIGLAFQVVDDILDVTADSATLGKTAGKDADADKPTYVSLLGLPRARAYAQELHAQALAALTQSGLNDVRALRALADMVVERSH